MKLNTEHFMQIKKQYEEAKASKRAVYNNPKSSYDQLEEASSLYNGKALGWLEFILSQECPEESELNAPDSPSAKV